MRTIFYCLLLSLVISCQSGDKKNDINLDSAKANSEKYQMDVFQTNENDFNIVCLNKFTGAVFIRNNNGSWYNAQDMKDLKKYTTPTYTMKIINGNKTMFQIVLLNGKNGNVYVRAYSSTWYDASGVRALEN